MNWISVSFRIPTNRIENCAHSWAICHAQPTTYHFLVFSKWNSHSPSYTSTYQEATIFGPVVFIFFYSNVIVSLFWIFYTDLLYVWLWHIIHWARSTIVSRRINIWEWWSSWKWRGTYTTNIHNFLHILVAFVYDFHEYIFLKPECKSNRGRQIGKWTSKWCGGGG